MFCPTCGFDCKDENFCPKCGRDVRAFGEAVPPRSDPAPGAPSTPTPPTTPTANQVLCPSCGADCKNEKFCPKCGRDVEAYAKSVRNTPKPTPTPTVPTTPTAPTAPAETPSAHAASAVYHTASDFSRPLFWIAVLLYSIGTAMITILIFGDTEYLNAVCRDSSGMKVFSVISAAINISIATLLWCLIYYSRTLSPKVSFILKAIHGAEIVLAITNAIVIVFAIAAVASSSSPSRTLAIWSYILIFGVNTALAGAFGVFSNTSNSYHLSQIFNRTSKIAMVTGGVAAVMGVVGLLFLKGEALAFLSIIAFGTALILFGKFNMDN